MTRRVGLVAVAALVMSAAPAGATAQAGITVPCRGAALEHLRGNAREVVRARTFHIVAEPQAKSFAIGSKARIEVTVTRPAHEDPLDLGVELEPPASMPAENVYVGLGVHVGQVFVPGFGITDPEGHTSISIKLPSYMKPGTAAVAVYAWNVVHESPCLRIEEDGYASYPESFEVTR
jgi:hypothetical protein